MTTPATVQKRQALLTFIQQVLAPEPAVQAVIGTGSIATGTARPGSDIDAIVIFEPFDPYIVPAEFIWLPADHAFHSIFSQAAGAQTEGVQFDFFRVTLDEWRAAITMPDQAAEARRAELAESWLAFDRHQQISQLVAEWIVYPEALRMARLDEALVWLDQHLKWSGEPQVLWESLAPATAHDRLHAAYGYLVQALFAYNRRWRPWRNREMTYLLRLPWLPANFSAQVLTALNAPAHDYAGYLARFAVLNALFVELLTRLVQDGDYAKDDPVGEAFIRRHAEPGRAWNMQEWNARHAQRLRANKR